MTITDIPSLRLKAKRRIPRAVFDYVDGGSYTEQTLGRNTEKLREIQLIQRVMQDVTDRDTSTKIMGQDCPMPLVLGPTGLTGMIHPNGEVAAFRAACAAGIPYTLCTPAIGNTDDLHESGPEPFWFQIYVMRDKEFTRHLLNRARRAGCKTLVITVDLVVNALRHKDARSGLAIPFKVTLPTALDALTKPGWFLRMTRSKRRTFGNFEGYFTDKPSALSMAEWVGQQYEPLLTPDNLLWIRDEWDGQVILKGVMTPEDAQTAVDFGADGIVVSNHGGRQLDGALSVAEALPVIRQQVGDQIAIFADSGIRTGMDIFRLLALGADACWIGRAYLYGLGAAGQAGVSKAIDILHKELDVAMALTGCRSLSDIGPDRITCGIPLDATLNTSIRSKT